MAKKLSLTTVKESNKKYSVIKRIDFDEDTYLDIHPNFSPSKVTEMLSDFQYILKQAQDEGIEFGNEMIVHYLNCMMIKHFTNISLPKKVEQLIAAFNVLLDNLDYYPVIMKEFTEASKLYVYKTYTDFIKMLPELVKQMAEMKQNNPELFKDDIDLNNKEEVNKVIEQAKKDVGITVDIPKVKETIETEAVESNDDSK